MSDKLRKVAEQPGECPACKGRGSISYFPGPISPPRSRRCDSCQGTGHQSMQQILINEGANAAVLGAMPLDRET